MDDCQGKRNCPPCRHFSSPFLEGEGFLFSFVCFFFFFLSGVDENYSSRSIFVTIQIDRSDVSFRSMLGQVGKSKGKG